MRICTLCGTEYPDDSPVKLCTVNAAILACGGEVLPPPKESKGDEAKA